jgi:LPXTG-site transpeptidase (sortase) family protein
VQAEDQGRRTIFNFADIANTGDVDEVLTIDYDVVVLNNQENVRSDQLNNDALWLWASGSLRDTAAEVIVVEPTLTLGKSADRTVVFPGGLITFTLQVGQDVVSDADAFDLLLEDLLPVDLIYESGTLRWTGVGLAPTGLDDTGNPILRATWDVFPLGAFSEIAFEVRLGAISPGERVTNAARLAWSSLPGDVSAPQSPYNSLSTERYYDPGSDVNIYFAIAELTVTAPALPETGFAPGVATFVPPQSEDMALRGLDDFMLDVPILGVRTPVVGVPLGSRGWDVTWLGNRAGYLEGTAFPTQLGTSLITAHVYDSSGDPGPFVDLSSLVWGDEIILHVSGVEYVYQVTSSFVIHPDDMSILRNDGYYRLTLLTCRGYDEVADTYAHRLAVQSVLVEVRDLTD